MFAIARAAVTNSPAVATIALIIFLGGTSEPVPGIALMDMSSRTSQDGVDFEVHRVLQPGK